MAYKQGDRVYWNASGDAQVPNYWTGTVMENEIPGKYVVIRHDGYPYTGPYVPGHGCYHTHISGILLPMPAGMKLSTKDSIFAKDKALWNGGLPTSNAAVSANIPLVNDYTCTLCKNDRLSRAEKSCWWCGQPVTHS